MSNSKTRISGISFIRMMCCFGVIIFHYYIHSTSSYKLFTTTPNGDWGEIFVAVFFMLSGGLLYINHAKITNLFRFYKKRFLSIFPAFYLAYAFYYIENILSTGKVFWSGKKIYLLLSFTGLDGYLNYLFPSNYYILGEWFLGALVLLYLLYPLIAYLIDHYNVYFMIGFSLLYIVFLFTQLHFTILPTRNLISCLMSFVIGIYLMKYRRYLFNSKVFLAALVLFAVSLFIEFPGFVNAAIKLQAISLFIILRQIGSLLEHTFLQRGIKGIGNITYEMFLLQHMLIIKFLNIRNYQDPIKAFLFFLIVLVMIMIYSKVLNIVASYLKDLIRKPDKGLR